jgi:hypothetical protein
MGDRTIKKTKEVMTIKVNMSLLLGERLGIKTG